MLGWYLETLSWPEAEKILRKSSVILLPIGARAKEHGYHLPLNNDWLLAEYLTRRVLQQFPAVAMPTVPYGYYPAFIEYPGSVNIQRATFAATIADICRSLARHSTARFYVLNTGISTNWALEPARLELAADNIVMEYTDLRKILPEIENPIRQQSAGTHADEMETSLMLYIQPDVVKMELARPDIDPRRSHGPLTRDPQAERGVYSPTGAWGDPTLATVEKGRIVTEALVARIVSFLGEFVGSEYEAAPARTEYCQS